MLLWQAYSFEMKSEKEIEAKGPPKHFFFDPKMDDAYTPGGPATNAVIHMRAANVQQETYWTTGDREAGSFESHVVLKNRGNARAVAIQVEVRPYRGIPMGEDGRKSYILPESDPLSQFGQWVSAPDLAPDESCTQTVTFVARPGYTPGYNPYPQIMFKTEEKGTADSQ